LDVSKSNPVLAVEKVVVAPKTPLIHTFPVVPDTPKQKCFHVERGFAAVEAVRVSLGFPLTQYLRTILLLTLDSIYTITSCAAFTSVPKMKNAGYVEVYEESTLYQLQTVNDAGSVTEGMRRDCPLNCM
jgi:hypothetical protein